MNPEQAKDLDRLAALSLRWNALAWEVSNAYDEQKHWYFNWRLGRDEVHEVMAQALWAEYRYRRYRWDMYPENLEWEKRAAADGNVPRKMPIRPTVDQPHEEVPPNADVTAAFGEFLGADRLARLAA